MYPFHPAFGVAEFFSDLDQGPDFFVLHPADVPFKVCQVRAVQQGFVIGFCGDFLDFMSCQLNTCFHFPLPVLLCNRPIAVRNHARPLGHINPAHSSPGLIEIVAFPVHLNEAGKHLPIRA